MRPEELLVPNSGMGPPGPPGYHTIPPPSAVSSQAGQLAGRVCDMFSSIMETPAHEITAMPTLQKIGVDSLVTEVLNEIQHRFGTMVSVTEFQSC